jgi:hypothetical protein
MNMTTRRWLTFLDAAARGVAPVTSHYQGFPASISPVKEAPLELPSADFVILEETSQGFYLFRYTRSGEFAGDTWHQNRQDALEQAGHEFGEAEMNWQEIPQAVADPVAYAMHLLGAYRFTI